jgi:DNA-binding NarL/FixJ family response regulator
MWQVLHVEDSRIAQVAVARAVRMVVPGSTVTGVASEAAAAAELARGAIDMAIVDLMLEEGQGYNVLGLCRQAHPKALIVVFSDFAAPGVAERCLAGGADAVFRKEEFHALTQFLAERGPARAAAADRRAALPTEAGNPFAWPLLA